MSIKMNNLNSLPDDLLLLILYQSNYQTLKSLCGTSRRIQLICTDKNFWLIKFRLIGDIIQPSLPPDLDTYSLGQLKNLYTNIADSGDLYTCGRDDYGKLGYSGTQYIPTKVPHYTNSVKQIVCGRWSTAIITYTNQLIILGKYARDHNSGKIIVVNNVDQISLGRDHAAFIVKTQGKSNKLYTFGDNSDGQLGLGNTVPINKYQQVLLPEDINPIYVACGTFQTIIVTDKGQAYACGNMIWGVLGLKPNPEPQIFFDVEIPTLISSLDNIKSVSCGEFTTAFITHSGKLYVCGYNGQGQLGIDDTNTDRTVYEPIKIPQLGKKGNAVIQVSCSANHTVILTISGQVFTCGGNNFGELGLGWFSKDRLVYKPTIIPHMNNIVQIATSEFRTLMLTDTGDVYMCGIELGRHTNDPTGYISIPTLIFSGAKQISSGLTHMAFITKSDI